MESTEALPVALNKRQGAVCRILASASRPMLIEWCSICFPFPARAGIQSTFPQSHTQWKSLSYMLPLKLRWSEFLQTMGQLPTKWVGDKGQLPHWLSLLSLVPPRDESQGQVRQMDIQLFKENSQLYHVCSSLLCFMQYPSLHLLNIWGLLTHLLTRCMLLCALCSPCSCPFSSHSLFQWHDSTHLW